MPRDPNRQLPIEHGGVRGGAFRNEGVGAARRPVHNSFVEGAEWNWPLFASEPSVRQSTNLPGGWDDPVDGWVIAFGRAAGDSTVGGAAQEEE